MRAVNLLPAKAGASGRRTPGLPRRPLAIAAAALVVVGIGDMAYNARAEVSTLTAQVDDAQAERATLQAQLSSLTVVEREIAAQTARKGAVVSLASGRVNWERLLRDTMTVLPPQVWLSQMSGVAPGSSTTAPIPAGAAVTAVPVPAPQGLHLEGFAFTPGSVAQLMARMEAVPGLGEPRMASLERTDRGGKRVLHFIIDAPVDQRAQDRPVMDVVTPGAVTASAGPGEGSMVP